MLVVCLVCLSGALLGTMKIQNQLMVLCHLAPWRSQHEVVSPAESAVYAVVLESGTLTQTEEVHPKYRILNRTTRDRQPKDPPPTLFDVLELELTVMPATKDRSAIFAKFGLTPDAVADFSLKNTRSYSLNAAPNTRLAFQLASEAELRDAMGAEVNMLSFSRVGFDVAMRHAVLYLGKRHDAGLDSRFEGYYVHLVKRSSHWVVSDAYRVLSIAS